MYCWQYTIKKTKTWKCTRSGMHVVQVYILFQMIVGRYTWDVLLEQGLVGQIGFGLPRMTLWRDHGELFPAYYYRSLFAWRQWRSLWLRLVAWSWSLDLMLSRLNMRRLGSSGGYISRWWRTETCRGRHAYNYTIYIHNCLNKLNEWTGNALRMVSNIIVLGNQSQV